MQIRVGGRLVLVVVVAALLVAWLASAAAAPRRQTSLLPGRNPPSCFLCGEPRPGHMRSHRLKCDAYDSRPAPGTRGPAERGPRAVRPGGPPSSPSSPECPPRGHGP
jgi:hypothetical protein